MQKILSLALAAMFLLGACTEKDKEPIFAPGAAPSITSPSGGTSYVLTESTAGDIFSLFSWSAADFGYKAGVNYTLQLDKAGNNFADPLAVGSVNALGLSNVTQEKINELLIIGKDLLGGEEANIEFRVVAKVSSDASIPTLVSQPITLKITPYPIIIVYDFLHVPGSYQGWRPADSSTVIYSARGDGKFEGYIYFSISDAKFKYTDGPTWAVNYGDNGNNGTLEAGGSDIPLTDAGLYKLNVDLNALTHSNLKTDWGVIGSATPGGWDSDQDLIYDAATNTLKVTLDLVVGELKFRANNDWALNFGDNDANKKLEYGGANIAVTEAGNYTIELNLSKAIYTYKITRN
ncbi:MAG: SusE domain-containing protein [Saprospiraceae bacterium]